MSQDHRLLHVHVAELQRGGLHQGAKFLLIRVSALTFRRLLLANPV